MENYFLCGSLSMTLTDDPCPDRRCCIFIGRRVFYGSHRVAQLLLAIEHGGTLEQITSRLNGDASAPALTQDQVRSLIEQQCVAQGLVSREAGTTPEPAARKPNLFFARTLIPGHLVARLCRPFCVLFAPRVVLVALALCAVLLLAWIRDVFAAGGSFQGEQSFFGMSPTESVICYALLFGCFLLHEFGHAAASRRFGAKPAEIGVGLYLVFPVLYCNVSAAWPLPRGARVAVNLGGAYFQLLACALLAIPELIRHSNVLSLVIAANLVSVVVTLNPFFRFDGYWVYSDLFRLPNLRQSARQLIARRGEQLVRWCLRSAPTPSVRRLQSRSLHAYAAGSLLFFSWFALQTGTAGWKLMESTPALLRAGRHRLDSAPGLETLLAVGVSGLLYIICALACALTLAYIAATLVRGSLVLMGNVMAALGPEAKQQPILGEQA